MSSFLFHQVCSELWANCCFVVVKVSYSWLRWNWSCDWQVLITQKVRFKAAATRAIFCLGWWCDFSKMLRRQCVAKIACVATLVQATRQACTFVLKNSVHWILAMFSTIFFSCRITIAGKNRLCCLIPLVQTVIHVGLFKGAVSRYFHRFCER